MKDNHLDESRMETLLAEDKEACEKWPSKNLGLMKLNELAMLGTMRGELIYNLRRLLMMCCGREKLVTGDQVVEGEYLFTDGEVHSAVQRWIIHEWNENYPEAPEQAKHCNNELRTDMINMSIDLHIGACDNELSDDRLIELFFNQTSNIAITCKTGSMFKEFERIQSLLKDHKTGCVSIDCLQLDVNGKHASLHLFNASRLVWGRFIELVNVTYKVNATIYEAYLQSPEWKARAEAAKVRAGLRCQVCNAADQVLDAHHRTYERLGHELDDDLIVLCRTCHDIFHQHGRLAK